MIPRRVRAPEIEAEPKVAEEEKRLVEEAVVEKKFVVVALVPVALLKVKFWNVDDALARMLLNVPVPLTVNVPPVPVVKKRLVLEAVVLKKFVVVALVPVAVEKVKFVRVDDAVERKPFRKPIVVEVETPYEVTVKSKVEGHAVLQVLERQREDAVSVPMLPVVVKRLVLDAVVAKKFVVVALVPVALLNVKFCRVEEAVAKMLAKVPRVVVVMLEKLGDAVVFTDWSNQSLRVGAPFTVKL